MKIYTKTGDRGETSLFGGQRVPKSHVRIDAYGTVDELNAVLGMIRSSSPHPELDQILDRLQQELFVVGADLATPAGKEKRNHRVDVKHILELEKNIDHLQSGLESLQYFILPGGSSAASFLHFARTVCRRAERLCILCRETETVSDEVIKYLNRLSDLLFVMARAQNKAEQIGDVIWKQR